MVFQSYALFPHLTAWNKVVGAREETGELAGVRRAPGKEHGR